MQRNLERARGAMMRWRQRHPEEHRAELRRYYAKDPAGNRARIDASPNREAVRRAMHLRRRAREANAEGTFSAAEWRNLLERSRGRCAYCGADGEMEADHRIPLARGGAHSIDNILPACGACNRRKHTRTEDEYRAWLRERELPS